MSINLILFLGLSLGAIYYLLGQIKIDFEFEEFDESDQLYLKYLHNNTIDQF